MSAEQGPGSGRIPCGPPDAANRFGSQRLGVVRLGLRQWPRPGREYPGPDGSFGHRGAGPDRPGRTHPRRLLPAVRRCHATDRRPQQAPWSARPRPRPPCTRADRGRSGLCPGFPGLLRRPKEAGLPRARFRAGPVGRLPGRRPGPCRQEASAAGKHRPEKPAVRPGRP